MPKSKFLLFTLFIYTPLHAEIATDGSLGNRVNLNAPNYQITQDLGKRIGDNLFHSFDSFNIYQGESATFSGDNGISNVISRVTGGKSSTIDGTLRNIIPNSDTYFINPAGVLFGQNAYLDVQGSFHVSTADYLRLGKNEKFYANLSENSVLSVADPSAFGFLDNSPQSISTQNTTLSVPYSKTLSLVGGDLDLKGELVFNESGAQQFRTYAEPLLTFTFLIPVYTHQLLAESGTIHLASLASQGEVPLNSNVELSKNTTGGNITISNTDINVNGESGGSIFIQGGKLQLVNSHLESQTLGSQDGKLVNIQVDELILQGDENYSSINTDTMGAGQSSAIHIRAKNMTASGGVSINGSTHSAGNPANIRIQVADSLTFLGRMIPELSASSAIQSIVMNVDPTIEKHNSSVISVEVGELILTDSASIVAITVGAKNSSAINVKVRNSLKISGVEFLNEDIFFSSGIMTISFTGSPLMALFGIFRTEGGDSGNITIEAGQIEVKEGGMISADSYVGKSGNLQIRANELIISEGGFVNAFTEGIGDGGTINLDVKNLTVSDFNISNPFGDFYSMISTMSTSPEDNAGIAGKIIIHADKIQLKGYGAILTTSTNAAGGNIDLHVPNLLYLQGGSIETSVHGGQGDGGNIHIDNPNFIALNKGKIHAHADEGNGGNIQIKSGHFLSSNGSVDASSRLGIDGEIRIDSPDVDFSGQLLILSADVLDASGQIQPPCSVQLSKNKSSFIVKKLYGSPSSPTDWQSNILVLLPENVENTKQVYDSKDKILIGKLIQCN